MIHDPNADTSEIPMALVQQQLARRTPAPERPAETTLRLPAVRAGHRKPWSPPPRHDAILLLLTAAAVVATATTWGLTTDRRPVSPVTVRVQQTDPGRGVPAVETVSSQGDR